jgi:hypothetical protein
MKHHIYTLFIVFPYIILTTLNISANYPLVSSLDKSLIEIFVDSTSNSDYFWHLESVVYFIRNSDLVYSPNFSLWLPGMSIIFYFIELLPGPFKLLYLLIILILNFGLMYLMIIKILQVYKKSVFKSTLIVLTTLNFAINFLVDPWTLGEGLMYSSTIGPLIFAFACFFFLSQKYSLSFFLFFICSFFRFEYLVFTLFLLVFNRKKRFKVNNFLYISLLLIPYSLIRIIFFGLDKIFWSENTKLKSGRYFIPDDKLVSVHFPNSPWVQSAQINWPCDLNLEHCQKIYSSILSKPELYSSLELNYIALKIMIQNPFLVIKNLILNSFYGVSLDQGYTFSSFEQAIKLSIFVIFLIILLNEFIKKIKLFQLHFKLLFVYLPYLLFFIYTSHIEPRYYLSLFLVLNILIIFTSEITKEGLKYD